MAVEFGPKVLSLGSGRKVTRMFFNGLPSSRTRPSTCSSFGPLSPHPAPSQGARRTNPSEARLKFRVFIAFLVEADLHAPLPPHQSGPRTSPPDRVAAAARV